MKRDLIAMQQPWDVEAYDLRITLRCRLRSRVLRNYAFCCGRWWAARVVDSLLVGSDWSAPMVSHPAVMDDPRYIFFLNWSDRVPSELIKQCECVNFHCTPLPYGRGGGPIENLILRGHAETVITAHRMVEELDAGPIYGKRGPVSLAGTKEQILDRFIEPVVNLIRWIVATEPEPYPQVGEVVTFKRLSKDAYEKFWKERT